MDPFNEDAPPLNFNGDDNPDADIFNDAEDAANRGAREVERWRAAGAL